MPVKWCEAETVRFVKLYKERQCLWDPALPDYRNNKKRNDAYEELQQEMGIEGFSINDVKQKIKNLRNTYSQEVSKIEKAINTGYSYVPQMKWFKIMDELVTKIRDNQPSLYFRDKSKKSGHHSVEEPDDADVIDIEMCNEGDEIEIDENIFQQQQQQTLHFQEQPSGFEEPQPTAEYSQSYENHVPPPTSSPSAGPSRKRRRTVVNSALRRLEQVNESLQEFLEDEDEWDAFGNYVGLSLKRLPLELSLEAQTEIQATLSKFKRMSHAPPFGGSGNPRTHQGQNQPAAATAPATPETRPEPTLTFYMNEKDGVQLLN